GPRPAPPSLAFRLGPKKANMKTTGQSASWENAAARGPWIDFVFTFGAENDLRILGPASLAFYRHQFL
ncbi:MAG: hypothetical protein MR874_09695, partial [Coriobacteriaceae bacterium]|nr:hypothetical protein [Coriobacteriaceae bacterium]